MTNNWEDYSKHFREIMAYIRDLKERHGDDGKSVAIEDLALRLARRRAGIDESVDYGQ